MDKAWFEERKRKIKVGNAQLGEAIGRDVSIVSKLFNGKVRFDVAFVRPFAELLESDPAEIAERAGIGVVALPPSNAKVIAFEGDSYASPDESLPVWGSGLGAARMFDGEAVEQTDLNSGTVLEYVRRPTILKGKAEAYALHVQGSSMHPALPDGEIAVACRGMPLSVGDNVVVYLRPSGDDDDGERARGVLVKELIRRSASYVELRQYDPRFDFRVPMADVIRIDRILSRREMIS